MTSPSITASGMPSGRSSRTCPARYCWRTCRSISPLNIAALMYYPWRGQGRVVLRAKFDALRGVAGALRGRRECNARVAWVPGPSSGDAWRRHDAVRREVSQELHESRVLSNSFTGSQCRSVVECAEGARRRGAHDREPRHRSGVRSTVNRRVTCLAMPPKSRINSESVYYRDSGTVPFASRLSFTSDGRCFCCSWK